MEVFDKDGNPVENVFSQDELDAKIAEAVKAVKPKEEEKKETPPAPVPTPNDEVMNAIKALQETVGTLVKSSETTGTTKFTASLDEEKKIAFNTQFEALQKTGQYENTPEGIEKRAAAAYMLTTGESFDAGNFDMGNLSGTSGKSPAKPNAEQSEVDKQLSEVLGNTEEDVKKYSGNATT